MRIKRRKKASRFRGSHTHARGFKKKARGSGHRGGFGMAGTGKRGGAKKTLIYNLYGNEYFGKDKTLRRGNKPAKLKVINLDLIQESLQNFVSQGIAKDSKGTYELNLKGYKILADGSLTQKLIINASSASNSAIEKVKKAGGQIILELKEEKKNSAEKNKQGKAAKV